MRELLKITKALADGTRLRVLVALRGGELCACQITELFGLAPSTMSKHLSVLYQAGLVDSRKQGRWIYFSLANNEASPAARAALEWVTEAAGREKQIHEDQVKLRKILKLDPTELCKQQCR